MNDTALRPVFFVLTAFVVASVVACSSGPRLGSPTTYQMWLHFEQAGRIQSAMIQGDLPTARRAARTLASAPAAPGIGPEGEEHVEELARWARTIRDAPSFGEAAEATGWMAATCGDCHAETGGGPNFRHPAPPDGTGFAGHMILHSWAADRLWEGLVSASADSWERGAAVFAAEPLRSEGFSARALGYATRLHELGREAAGATERPVQAELYGRLLQQCSGCHAEVDPSQ